MRVALIRAKNISGAPFSDSVLRALRFNGGGVLENQASFRELTYTAEDPGAFNDLPRVEGELEAFAPHVILYTGGAPIVDRVFAPLEEHWPASRGPRPRYASVAGFTPEHAHFLAVSEERRRRWFGVTTLSATPENARFVTHYRETFPQDSVVSLTESPNSTYDAFYLLVYAAFASRGPVTGESLSHGIERLLPPGESIGVGIPGIFDAVSALRRGDRIDLVGATGSLDFDPSTGDEPFDQEIICAVRDPQTNSVRGTESGLIYRASSGRLEGTLRCD
jgi:hypothetical protein